MRLHINPLGLVCLTAALGSVAGCAGKIHYPSYYVLDLPAPAPASAEPKAFPGSVAIREFRAPGFLRAGPIVYRRSASQLEFYDYHRWAVEPRTAITKALVQSLEARKLFQSVHLFDGREVSDYLVTGTLDHLEEVDEGHVVTINVAVSAQLTDVRTGQVLWRDACSTNTRLEQRDVPAMVTEMSKAAEGAVEQLASSMQNRVALMSASLNRKESVQP